MSATIIVLIIIGALFILWILWEAITEFPGGEDWHDWCDHHPWRSGAKWRRLRGKSYYGWD